MRSVDHRIEYWNRGAERMYGWPASEAVGVDIRRLIYDDSAAFEMAMASLMAEGSWKGDLLQCRRDGSTITVADRWPTGGRPVVAGA